MFLLSSGLCTLVGIILYIGSITGEVGNKPRATIETPKFEYHYGSSFIMSVGSFILTEFSGVFSVYLYMSKHKQSQRAKRLALKTEHNDRSHHVAKHIRRCLPRENSCDAPHSRERSRDPSQSRSESYFTYTPISDNTSHELSSYTFPRENTNNTISTTAELHGPRADIPVYNYATPTTAIVPPTPSVRSVSPPSVIGSIDIVRRTTPV